MRSSSTFFHITRSRRGGASRIVRRLIRTEAVVLTSYPRVSDDVDLTNFERREIILPDTLPHGHVELETLYLSVDPYMRCRFGPEHPQLGEYLDPFQLLSPVAGGGVGRVVRSTHSNFRVGDFACLPFDDYPWQRRVHIDVDKYTRSDGWGLAKIDWHASACQVELALALGTLGMPGLTSYCGMLEAAKPCEGETVVISGAAGACGTLAGQIARMSNARVVGICGSDEKCDFLKRKLGFDSAINYKSPSFLRSLNEACADGVDCYFDNVGGFVSEAVLRLVNTNARIPVCGQIASYSEEVAYTTLVSAEGIPPDVASELEAKRANRFRYLVLDHSARFPTALKKLRDWTASGALRSVATVTRGFRPAEAFISMMSGGNIGKAIVEVCGRDEEGEYLWISAPPP